MKKMSLERVIQSVNDGKYNIILAMANTGYTRIYIYKVDTWFDLFKQLYAEHWISDDFYDKYIDDVENTNYRCVVLHAIEHLCLHKGLFEREVS